ncbi:MAG: hypothetical protein JRJ35_08295 [Deltaproteobacteria bacterium]|nr:hypothetical protein [Deltaproteobacteria bacterium]MBW1923459.1 hypothetical protein [Deltaproteobacteria bacterium]MBW1949620.1 hypothetical protein [Deltaproteobacteria bacterium]MBW2007812.1 hypothetical protein [Deltaproteobacteria bacterium]
MEALFWWVRHVVFTLAGVFFLAFGIQVLVAAYRLREPFLFLMTFFASNLMILISAALLVVFLTRMIRKYLDIKKTAK